MPRLPLLAFISTLAFAAEPAVRPVPPPGVAVPEAVRAELQDGVDALGAQLVTLRDNAELPSVEIFHKAVSWALKHDEFLDAKQFAIARDFLLQGQARAKDAQGGKPAWNLATGLVARGYRSAIDGSVQPYGLVVPSDWKPGDKPRPLHFWFHGRGEKLTELDFIAQRQRTAGEFVPEGAIVCHLYGRYCNANHFAGEVDLREALADIRKHYAIDENRVVIRGFSMGGAACWHFAMHFPGEWAAAAPGAGFSETEEFFAGTLYAKDATPPPWWERHLWRWYDATVVARNVAGLPLVAYSGEIDKQKQAADIMLRFAGKEGLAFTHIIGPATAHKYHPEAKPVIEKAIEMALVKGRDPNVSHVTYTTYSLIYPRRAWVELLGMEKSWERADIDAAIVKDTLSVTTKNVAALRLTPGVTLKKLVIDGTALPLDKGAATLRKANGTWQSANAPTTGKRPGVCGPVDHAFMSSFVHVRPTGRAFHDSTAAWTKSELDHALWSWRRVFRGDARVKDDSAIGDEDIANHNLVLWGDPSSNAVLKKIVAQLPLEWSREKVEFRGYVLDAATHMPILVFPNPLNAEKYIVLNSGHTFREFALLNNSDQTPKLPDWAIVDIRKPADAKWPGLIHDAGFFDEDWR
ncbi:MAG: prolyl oligopeptidase family serine peptidase [Chthoniobacteraceae bacterium]